MAMLGPMDDRRFGLVIRALRRRLGWRQSDLAERAGVSQQAVSEIERGRVRDKSLDLLRRVAGPLDAKADIDVSWRGGALDRFLDRRHASIVERVVEILLAYGWEVEPEVSFSHFGDRGSIDVLAWKAAERAVAIFEIKPDLTSVEETNRRLDVKRRLIAGIVRERRGWAPDTVGTFLVLPDESTARRRVSAHPRTFATRYPNPGRGVRAWLRAPRGPFAAVWFLSGTGPGSGKREPGGPDRVRRPRISPEPDPEP